jgi:hypothetical protein
MGKWGGREGREIGESSVIDLQEALCAPLRTIEAIFVCPEMTNLSRPIARIVSLD